MLTIQLKLMVLVQLMPDAGPDAKVGFLSQTGAHILIETALSQGCFFIIYSSPQATETALKLGQKTWPIASALR